MNQNQKNKTGIKNGAWYWQCNSCGKEHNNITMVCSCGTFMTCLQAGGHHDFDGDGMCDKGCGTKL